MDNSKLIRVAIFQTASAEDEVSKNFSKVEKLFHCLKSSPRLIVLPEMWPSGFRVVEGEKKLEQTEAVLQKLAQYARELNSYIIGSHLSRAPKGFYNTATIMDPRGKILASYHKVHLFALGGESKKFKAGNKSVVASTKIGKIGLAICYDIRFPEFIRKEVLKGAELICVPSAWPLARIEHYRLLLRARAIENQCFVLSANKVGKSAEGIEYGGHSVAIDPWGEVLGELKTKEGILELEINLQKVKETRKKFPVLSARREKVYTSKT